MMNSNAFLLAAIVLIISAATARAQQSQSTTPPATASAEVMQCAQAQMVVDRLLSTANARLETARQTNSAGDMRAAVDELQATLRDIRAQLAPCANVQPATDAHAGHTMPNVQQAPTAAPRTPAMPPGSTARPAAVAPGAKPPAGGVDPHAGHVKPAAPAKPTPSAKAAPAAKPPSAKPPSGTAPSTAPIDHSKMDMGTAAKPAPKGTKPAPPAAPMDHSKMPMPTASDPSAQATDPVCGLKVDPASAPSTKHQGQTYYFCSEQHQQLFQNNPVKFLPKQQ
jgi:YHS domain-containing protein